MEKQTVKSYAIKLMVSTKHLLLNKPISLDRRYNFNKEVLAYIAKHKAEIDKDIILAKRKERFNNKKQPFTNILSNPLVKDFKNNRFDLKSISNEGLHFIGGRNHWAKNSLDFKVLGVLKTFINN